MSRSLVCSEGNRAYEISNATRNVAWRTAAQELATALDIAAAEDDPTARLVGLDSSRDVGVVDIVVTDQQQQAARH